MFHCALSGGFSSKFSVAKRMNGSSDVRVASVALLTGLHTSLPSKHSKKNESETRKEEKVTRGEGHSYSRLRLNCGAKGHNAAFCPKNWSRGLNTVGENGESILEELHGMDSHGGLSVTVRSTYLKKKLPNNFVARTSECF